MVITYALVERAIVVESLGTKQTTLLDGKNWTTTIVAQVKQDER